MRAGFFLGDGAGVGKGRTIAACIKEHFAAGHGTRALWVSVSKDLNFDAQRDLDDVRANTCVYPEVCYMLLSHALPELIIILIGACSS